MNPIDADADLAEVFVRLADSLRPRYDVIDTMDLVVESCTTFTDAVEAGILLRGAPGTLHVVASTSERASDIEEEQLGSRGGPCLSSIQSGEMVEVPDIRATKEEWPGFAVVAETRGLQGAHAFPLRLRTDVFGGLNLFFDHIGLLSDRDAAIAAALAQIATMSIVKTQTTAEPGTVSLQIQRALDSRVMVEHAKGVIAQQRGIAMDGAFTLLRNHARTNRTGLRAVAERVARQRLIIE